MVQFKSCDEFTQKFQELGFKINWTLLKIGYEGEVFLPKLISFDIVSKFAERIIEQMDYGYELISLLISPKDEHELHATLEKLARNEMVDISIQRRKLRVCVVQKVLKELPSDYLKGLIELASLWGGLGFPHDSPHVFQGVNNIYTPQEYYTQDMYDRLVHENASWIEDEIKIINLQEK